MRIELVSDVREEGPELWVVGVVRGESEEHPDDCQLSRDRVLVNEVRLRREVFAVQSVLAAPRTQDVFSE